MINEKLFPQYVFEYRYCWTAPELLVAAQIVVADPDGRRSVTLWVALDLRLRLWRWTVHLHSLLNQSKGTVAPRGFLPWFYPSAHHQVSRRCVPW